MVHVLISLGLKTYMNLSIACTMDDISFRLLGRGAGGDRGGPAQDIGCEVTEVACYMEFDQDPCDM